MVTVHDQAHKLPEPLIRRPGIPRQPGTCRLVINAYRSPATAIPLGRRLMIQGLDLCQLRLPVRRRLPHVMDQAAIASQRASLKGPRESLGKSSRAIQMISQQMARTAVMWRAVRPQARRL